MKKTLVLCLLAMAAFFMMPTRGESCSCTWKGPFLAVAREAPLVVRGKIIRHHPGPEPVMDVHVLETLAGGILDSGLSVQMGDGMHCRPLLDGFLPGSEWILALNGPGAKPGSGWALSHCGEFWLRVDGGEVLGSINGERKQVKRMPLDEFRNRFRYPRFSGKISGSVQSGEKFSRPFGPAFEFVLEPTAAGWEIVVREYGREENLARLTPPLHFAPNPRAIGGWRLFAKPEECGKRPYGAESGPANPREFIFSPEVGKSIDGAAAGRAVSAGELALVETFGRGELTIEKFALAPGENGCLKIERMEFSVLIEGGVE